MTLFLDRRLPPARASSVEGHIDGCGHCRRLLSALARGRSSDPALAAEPADAELDAGDRIDRFVLLRVIGSGGMGTVYAAYDPMLDRKVALKLVRRGTTNADRRARLIREAQAMARVSSPNVVSVYDVGTVRDQVYIAMELVAGGTLKTWLRDDHTWREVLNVLEQAGRGLAAAHANGIVHRDFKPDNVLIDGDRVRVADFGLAAPADQATDAIAGTPAYMAPEQLAGEQVDARSDQFSFCVALYEALYGTRPFDGDTLDELVREVRAGRVRVPTARPAWLRQIVLRGLAADPAERHASMHALLDELARRRSRRRSWIVTAAALTAIGAAGYGIARRGEPAPTCQGFERQLDGVWDPQRRIAAQTGMLAAHVPASAITEAERSLDRYTSAWVAMRGDACEATRIRGEQSERVLDLRMQCLDRRRDGVDALVTQLANATPASGNRVIYAIHGLEPIADCANVAALEAQPAMPPNAAIPTWQRQIADARAHWQLGDYRTAETLATAVATSAAAAHARSLEAEALLVAATAIERLGDGPRADRTYRDAALAAEASRADRLAAQARIGRIKVAIDAAQYDTAKEAVLAASAAVERAGAPVRLRAQLTTQEGILAAAQGNYETARSDFQATLDALGPLRDTDELDLARATSNLGGSLVSLGKNHDAEAAHRRALELRRKYLGDTHPDVGTSLIDLAQALTAQGHYAESAADLTEALAIYEGAFGHDHPRVAVALGELALVDESLGKLDTALALYRRALAIEEQHGADRPEVALLHNNIGDVLDSLGERDRALDEYRLALALREKLFGPDHPDNAQSLNNIANTLGELGRYQDALATYQRALDIKTRAFGSEHIRLAPTLVGIAEMRIALHDAEHAITPLERACTLYAEGEPENLATARFDLARALWDSKRDRKRAVTLAEQARAAFAALGDPHKRELADVTAWIKAKAAE